MCWPYRKNPLIVFRCVALAHVFATFHIYYSIQQTPPSGKSVNDFMLCCENVRKTIEHRTKPCNIFKHRRSANTTSATTSFAMLCACASRSDTWSTDRETLVLWFAWNIFRARIMTTNKRGADAVRKCKICVCVCSSDEYILNSFILCLTVSAACSINSCTEKPTQTDIQFCFFFCIIKRPSNAKNDTKLTDGLTIANRNAEEFTFMTLIKLGYVDSVLGALSGVFAVLSYRVHNACNACTVHFARACTTEHMFRICDGRWMWAHLYMYRNIV